MVGCLTPGGSLIRVLLESSGISGSRISPNMGSLVIYDCAIYTLLSVWGAPQATQERIVCQEDTVPPWALCCTGGLHRTHHPLKWFSFLRCLLLTTAWTSGLHGGNSASRSFSVGTAAVALSFLMGGGRRSLSVYLSNLAVIWWQRQGGIRAIM